PDVMRVSVIWGNRISLLCKCLNPWPYHPPPRHVNWDSSEAFDSTAGWEHPDRGSNSHCRRSYAVCDPCASEHLYYLYTGRYNQFNAVKSRATGFCAVFTEHPGLFWRFGELLLCP